ncbi:MAG: Fur family transcriptional regulator peroxide stress response regulator [Anaerolineaceae bacterium]|nr:MAG: Fur family transcriptional regulator peroxide stress response regulator [Anaerolineaceae bacterium]
MLHSGGKRLTKQRQLALDVLQESAEHLDAEAVYARAKARDPKISIATIYRTLALLKEAGLVEENRLGEEHAHFEATRSTPHYHFTCLRCGRVIEFDTPQVQEAIQSFCTREKIQLVSVQLLLSGYCALCRREEE